MDRTDIDALQRIFGLFSRLLQYPDAEWREQLPDLRAEAGSIPDTVSGQRLSAFLDRAESTNELAWQAGYVRTFDFDRKSNLYLTYARHGDERERAAALLELKGRYAAAGFQLESGELPDYLPLVLEFAAAAPWEAAEDILAGEAEAIRSIGLELKESGSPYADLFDRLQQLVSESAPARSPMTPQTERGGMSSNGIVCLGNSSLRDRDGVRNRDDLAVYGESVRMDVQIERNA